MVNTEYPTYIRDKADVVMRVVWQQIRALYVTID